MAVDNPESLVGKTIRLIEMPHDPEPIATGTIGIVRGCVFWGYRDGQPEYVLAVDWENGRSLNLIWPMDSIEVVEETQQETITEPF